MAIYIHCWAFGSLHLYFSTHSVHTGADEIYVYIQFAQKFLKAREQLQGLEADGKNSGIKNWESRMWNLFIWLQIGTNDGLVRTP